MFVYLYIFGVIFLFQKSYAEDNVCHLYPSKNFRGGALLTLRPSVKVFETPLVFHLPSDQGISVQSVKLSVPRCTLILCDKKHLEGDCVEFSSSLQDITVEAKNIYKNIHSVDCQCSNELPESGARRLTMTSEKLQNSRHLEPGTCASVFRDWHYKGQSHQILFPGAATKIDLGSQIRSISIKHGCTVMLWRLSNETNLESLSISSSSSFIKNGNYYDWSCCYCDTCSETVCKNAQSKSLTISRSTLDRTKNLDFSQFVKHGKKIIGIGRNYRWKNAELANVLEIPKQPIVFMKPTTSYITEGQPIQLPENLGTIFYELELGVVIGKAGKTISESQALDHVAGYFLALDMTSKQFLKRSLNQSLPWELGKGFDTACPVGNFIPKSHIPDPNNVNLECRVNGEITQSDNTSQMIFNVQKLISYVSNFMTLQPFDVILTGTPDGFGPLRPGDFVDGRLGNITSIQFHAESA